MHHKYVNSSSGSSITNTILANNISEVIIGRGALSSRTATHNGVLVACGSTDGSASTGLKINGTIVKNSGASQPQVYAAFNKNDTIQVTTNNSNGTNYCCIYLND